MVRKNASDQGLESPSNAGRLANGRSLRNMADPLEELVAATYADVWRLCSALVDAEQADDLAQETFLRATTALQRFRGRASRRTWIFAIARHVCMDELRGRHRRRRRDARLAAVADPRHAADVSADVTTRELLVQLHPDRREAFVLTQMFRLSYEDAAAVCDCPTGTIRSRVARARDDLIALMGGDMSVKQSHHAPRANDGRAQEPGANV